MPMRITVQKARTSTTGPGMPATERKEPTRRGFTLLELLVVLFIVGMSAALAAPPLYRAYENLQAGVEERRLREMAAATSLSAFCRQQERTLHLADRTVRDQEEQVLEHFRFLTFPRQTIHWNANGFPDARQLHYVIRGTPREMPLY